MRITAGLSDTADNSQGASIDFHGNALGGNLDLVAGGATGALTFWTNNMQRGLWNADGNFGVGSANPLNILTVAGTFELDPTPEPTPDPELQPSPDTAAGTAEPSNE